MMSYPLNRHEARINDFINKYEENDDLPELARVKADNALLPVYRKELGQVQLEFLHVSDEERFYLPKSDANATRPQRQRRI